MPLAISSRAVVFPGMSVNQGSRTEQLLGPKVAATWEYYSEVLRPESTRVGH